MLSKHGKTHRFDSMTFGGAISNAENAKDIGRSRRYQAAFHVHAIIE